MIEATIHLAPREVVIVTGWYAERPLAEIARDVDRTPTGLAGEIRQMRRRGIALTERPNGWRASRGGTRG